MGVTSSTSHRVTGDIPSLDGIRAVAVALVFCAHLGLEHIVPGGLGVTIFFVLSGYLITTLLRTEHAQHERIDYRAFYLRRVLRLMPPLVVVVGLASILAALALTDPFTTTGLFSVLFYFGNYFVIAHDFAGLPAGLGVMWSLAVEEHFYLFYPPLAAVLLRVARPQRSALVLIGLCIAVFAWRLWLAANGASDNYLTMATDTRIDAILVGCLLAFSKNPWLTPHRPKPLRDYSLIALALALLLFTLLYRDDFFRLTVRYVLQSAAIAVLLYFAVALARDWPFRWLNAKPVMYIGTISYSIYLVHHLIIETLKRQWPAMSWPVLALSAILLTLAVAEPMRRLVEQPCARLRKRLHRRAPPREPLTNIPQTITGSTL